MISTRYTVGSPAFAPSKLSVRFNGQQATSAAPSFSAQQPATRPWIKTVGAMLLGLSTLISLPGCNSAAVNDFNKQYKTINSTEGRVDFLKNSWSSPDAGVRQRVLDEIPTLNVDGTQKLALVKPALTDNELSIQLSAIKLLPSINVSETIKRDELASALSNPNARVRLAGLEAYQQLNLPGAEKLEQFTKLLHDTSPEVSQSAFVFGRKINAGSPDPVPFLDKGSQHENADIRLEALHGYQNLKSLSATDKLAKCLNAMDDKSSEIRQQALYYTQKLDVTGKELLPVFEKAFQDEKPEIRLQALQSILGNAENNKRTPWLSPKQELTYILNGFLDKDEAIQDLANKGSIYYESQKNDGVTEGISSRMQGVRELRPRVKIKDIKNPKPGEPKTQAEKLGDPKKFARAIEDFQAWITVNLK